MTTLRPARQPKGDPYACFNSDRERRKALLVREIRIAITVLIVSASTSPVLLALAQRLSN